MFYRPLTRENIVKIADLLLGGLKARLAEKELTLKLSDAAKNLIADAGYDPVYGARPMKRYLQSKLETLIARKILSDDPAPGATISVDAKDGELTVA